MYLSAHNAACSVFSFTVECIEILNVECDRLSSKISECCSSCYSVKFCLGRARKKEMFLFGQVYITGNEKRNCFN